MYIYISYKNSNKYSMQINGKLRNEYIENTIYERMTILNKIYIICII